MTDLFVYGTLLFKDIREALLAKDYQTLDATLHGYARKQISELPHAAIIKDEQSSVDGFLLPDISIPDTTILDKFHEDHNRHIVQVEIDGQKRFAHAYLPKEETDVSEQEWDPEEFSYVEFFLETVIPEFFENLSE